MTGSWHDLWNPQATKRIFTLDDQDEALAMGALLLGYDVNTSKQSQLDDIKKLLISQKKYLRAYSSDDVNNMSSGDAWIHHMWSGDFLYLRQGLAKHPELFDFEAPKEGVPINSDTYAIPANARHPGTAMVFIDYLLRPENVKKNMEYLFYPFPTRGGQEYFKVLSKDVPACYVDVKSLDNPARLPAAEPGPGAAPRGDVDRSEGELSSRPGGAGTASAPGCGARCSPCPPCGSSSFFVSSMVIVVLLSFGRTQRDGRPVFGTRLTNYDALWNERLPRAVPALPDLRARHDGDLRR